MKIRNINISHHGAKHLTSDYIDVTLITGEGNEEEYIQKEYPEWIANKILAVKEDVIFLITKFRDRMRGGVSDAVGIQEAKKLCPEELRKWEI